MGRFVGFILASCVAGDATTWQARLFGVAPFHMSVIGSALWPIPNVALLVSSRMSTDVPEAPADAILGIAQACRVCEHPKKPHYHFRFVILKELFDHGAIL